MPTRFHTALAANPAGVSGFFAVLLLGGAVAAGGTARRPAPVQSSRVGAIGGKAGPSSTAGAPSGKPAPARPSVFVTSLQPWQTERRLAQGAALQISVRLERPSGLPDNGRVAAEWTLVRPDNPADVVEPPAKGAREVGALGIYTQPTAGWRKVLHALDPDVFLVYRAPVAGTYRLRVAAVLDEPPPGAGSRWREKGGAPDLFPVPARTPWPGTYRAPVQVALEALDLGTEEQVQKYGALLEAEPNDTPEQAQSLRLIPNEEVRTYEITGTADDIEYFDNGRYGRSGDDWFRVQLDGSERKLVTAQLGIPGQFVAARVRCYVLKEGAPAVRLGELLPIEEFTGTPNPKRPLYTEGKIVEVGEGRDPNERAHQQEEEHRTNISRLFEPGRTYYFRVEANAPGYQLSLRVLPPAPYTDARLAVRQAMYTQVGQVHAWLANRPRGASVDRRIRDTGNLLGTHCMSCHTQSGVWGPAVAVQNGYALENRQNFWQLLNIMYECLRPTNELKDAANNTSLAPLDVGDGPAGTRAAGFNIVNAESIATPRKLHASQQIRTANFVLLTADPGGINAAGPGSNIGRNIVWLFATEILRKAWDATGDAKYFRAMEERARNVLSLDPRYTDDLGVRLDYFGRVFPLTEYPAQARKAADAEKAAGGTPKGNPDDAPGFVEKVREQLRLDEARLRAIQNDDGLWGFQPGTSTDGGKSWKPSAGEGDPSPTALAITGLNAVGFGKDDPTIRKGVEALLRIQDANGRWNRAAITGFVPTAYSIRALARLYPVTPRTPRRADFVARPGEPLPAAVSRVQSLALAALPDGTDLLVQAAAHTSPLVRYWAMIGLGAVHQDAGVPVLVRALDDRAKPVRDAATWALRQTLLDDRGWDAAFAAAEQGSDYTRAHIMQALSMRADAVMPRASLDWARLGRLFDRAMNDDSDPATRAYASKAAWQWWIWNPPIRAAVNDAWVRALTRPEPNALVENNNRYASQALFIANGHKANGSREHQYKELATLFETLRKRLETAEAPVKSILARRLVAVSGTFYQTSGGDGGPGQLGYTTPGAGALMGQAVLVYLRETMPANNVPAIRWGLEGAANIPHGPLNEFLINFTLNAPEELRKEAAAAISDPRSAMLQAATELVEPLVEQVRRGANEPARRATLSDPVLTLFASVNWVIPEDEEQRRLFLDLMIPKLENYISPEEIAALPDAAAQEAARRTMDAEWYLADRLGEVLGSNPDLRLDMVFRRYFPEELANPLQRHFWVRSVPWLLEHRAPGATPAPPAPADGSTPQQQRVDPNLVIKDRALQLYLDALRPETLSRTHAAAIRLSNATAVKKNPEVLLALGRVLETEKDPQLRKIAENVVKQGSERFVPDLVAALRVEGRPGAGVSADGKVHPKLLEDVTYFRDYVMPELARVKRSDQMACLGCHGVPGRVPSFTLKPVDEFGYQSVPDLLVNYRAMQARVNPQDPDRSKILRKPLNVQDGKEDGHQGGRRYLPTDDGYLLLKKWVENQMSLMATLGGLAAGTPRSDREWRVALRHRFPIAGMSGSVPQRSFGLRSASATPGGLPQEPPGRAPYPDATPGWWKDPFGHVR